MSLAAMALGKAIKDAVAGKDTPEDCGKPIGDAIFKYIKDNATIMYTWAGVNPSGTPDPATSFTAPPASAGGSWAWPPASKPDTPASANSAFATAVNTLLNASPLDTGEWQIDPPLMMFSACTISPDEADPFTNIGQCIIDGLSVSPGGEGTHEAFTGAATGGTIS
jgi:hypothetical protein